MKHKSKINITYLLNSFSRLASKTSSAHLFTSIDLNLSIGKFPRQLF